METPETHSSLLKTLAFIVLGVLLGISVWALKDLFFSPQPNNPATNIPAKVFSLNLISPSDMLTTSNQNLVISGQTGVKAVVTITSGSQSVLVNSSPNFTAKITLSEGKNVLTITSFNPKTYESLKQTRTILYLNEDLSTL